MVLQNTTEAQLDAEIAHIRDEIARLRREKAKFSTALLSSDKLQRQLQGRHASANTSNKHQALLDVASAQARQKQIDVHRLAYGVTAFPFRDPDHGPDSEPTISKALLGVRFDLATRNGRAEEAPYYVVFRSYKSPAPDVVTNTSSSAHLKIAHHTIPNHIDIAALSQQHLRQEWNPYKDEDAEPEPMEIEAEAETTPEDEMSWQDDSGVDLTLDLDAVVPGTRREPQQDLHAFVRAVRDDLMSWWNRVQTVDWLKEELRLSAESGTLLGTPRYQVTKLIAETVDAQRICLSWSDASVGLLKVSRDGYIVIAVVCRADDSRLHQVERLLCYDDNGKRLPLHRLHERLKLCSERLFWDDQPMS